MRASTGVARRLRLAPAVAALTLAAATLGACGDEDANPGIAPLPDGTPAPRLLQRVASAEGRKAQIAIMRDATRTRMDEVEALLGWYLRAPPEHEGTRVAERALTYVGVPLGPALYELYAECTFGQADRVFRLVHGIVPSPAIWGADHPFGALWTDAQREAMQGAEAAIRPLLGRPLDPQVQGAWFLLARLPPEVRSPEGTRLLAEAMQLPDERLTGEAASALAVSGEHAHSAVPLLIEISGREDEVLSEYGEDVLRHLSSSLPEAAGWFIERYRAAEDPDLRRDRLGAMLAAGPWLATAIPDLIEALGSEDRRLAWLAADGLALVGREALPAMERAAEEGDANTREGLTWAIEAMPEPRSERALGLLARLARD